MKRNTDKCENLRLEKEIYCWFLNTLWKKNIFLIYLIKQFRVVRDEHQITATLATFKYVQVRERARESRPNELLQQNPVRFCFINSFLIKIMDH